MSTIPTNRESDRFMLRLPDGMRDRIKAAAESNNRSMNSEIVARLQATFNVRSAALRQEIDTPISNEALARRLSVSRHLSSEQFEEMAQKIVRAALEEFSDLKEQK